MTHLFASTAAVMALVPAALNPSLLVRGESLAALVCGGGAAVQIPLGDPIIPGTVGSACCAKGCHSSEKKKKSKSTGGIDPQQ